MESVKLDGPPTTLIAGVSGDLIEVARELGKKGERFALLSRSEDKLKQFHERLSHWGISSQYYVADVTDSSSIVDAFRLLTRWSLRLDRLIYNVGVVSNEGATQVTESELARVMSANFFGFVNCFQLAGPMFKRTGGGHAIIISGSDALNPESQPVAYAASKSSVQIYTKALRRELAGSKILITELYLGRIQTTAGWRWLTCEEIVDGVLKVVEQKPERLLVGVP